MERVFDRHHIFYIKRCWKNGYCKELRDYYYCVVQIPRNTVHHRIHARVNHVPVPRGASAKFALEHLDMLSDYGAIGIYDSIEKRLTVLIALFDCIEQPTADALRRQLDVVRSATHNSSL